MQLLPRLRLALARRPWVYWLFVASCAAIVWSLLTSSQTRLNEQRQRWGTTRRVWVAADDIAPGDLVRTIARDYPTAMVPDSAVDDEPRELLATSPIAAGEVIVASDVDGRGNDALREGWVAFAFADDYGPSLLVGDTVAVFGSGQRWCDGVVMATDGDGRLDVAVPPTCADAVSVQLAADAIVLALTSP